MRRKVYEASDGTVSIYHNNMIKTFNSFEEANVSDMEYLESQYLLLKDIKPIVKKFDDVYFELKFQNGRIEKIKKDSIYLKEHYQFLNN